ncbi:MAG: type II toxin-antitoxin system RelE/ParE family toxin [Thermoanaerobacteraceae bacterium]|nr:type II toxin-antitoxin system RelE/ParE family toxin [Thermoanaerobacteraceae bacterium]
MYRIILSHEAAKFINKSPQKLQGTIKKCLETIAQSPFQGIYIKKLKGEISGLYRYKLNDIRIIYKVNNKDLIIFVATIGNRGDVYKK